MTRYFRPFSLKPLWNWVTMRLQKPRRQRAGGCVAELAGETVDLSIIADPVQAISCCGVSLRCRAVECFQRRKLRSTLHHATVRWARIGDFSTLDRFRAHAVAFIRFSLPLPVLKWRAPTSVSYAAWHGAQR